VCSVLLISFSLSLSLAIKFFPCVVDTSQKYPKSLKFIAGVSDTAKKMFTGVNDTADKTVLTIRACLDLKMKNKQKFNLQRKMHSSKFLLLTKYEKFIPQNFPLSLPVSLT
jgi:hypothetical protein